MSQALRFRLVFAALCGLSACAQAPIDQAPAAPPSRPPVETNEFGATRPLPPSRSNVDMAQDFLDLTFFLESGKALPVFTRLEGPLTLAKVGQNSPALDAELDRLVVRLRKEAGLNIQRSSDPANAAITVEGITRRQMRRMVPLAACFVLPTRTTWAEFTAKPRNSAFLWSTLETREAVTVFIPVDTSRQEIRDCLHEEIAQGLGPLNDLYRLGDSIFNDDNVNTVLTGFDMLMLRTAYHPSLQSGMDWNDVAARVPRILASLNPKGERIAPQNMAPTPRAWTEAMTKALGPGSLSSRRNAARSAVAQAEAAGWNDVRTALSQFTLARLTIGRSPSDALNGFLDARDIYTQRADTSIYAANVAQHVAIFAMRAGQWELAINLTTRYIPIAHRFEDAALICDLSLTKAAVLEAMGRPDRALEQDARAWGVYAYGSAAAVSQREERIKSLVSRFGA